MSKIGMSEYDRIYYQYLTDKINRKQNVVTKAHCMKKDKIRWGHFSKRGG